MLDKVHQIVRLLEPELCQECPFAKMAEVTTADGVYQRMIYCRRLDCDNWDRSEAEPAYDVNPLPEAA